MHNIRRQAKYSAWYSDPLDEPSIFKNPFSKYRTPPSSRSHPVDNASANIESGNLDKPSTLTRSHTVANVLAKKKSGNLDKPPHLTRSRTFDPPLTNDSEVAPRVPSPPRPESHSTTQGKSTPALNTKKSTPPSSLSTFEKQARPDYSSPPRPSTLTDTEDQSDRNSDIAIGAVGGRFSQWTAAISSIWPLRQSQHAAQKPILGTKAVKNANDAYERHMQQRSKVVVVDVGNELNKDCAVDHTIRFALDNTNFSALPGPASTAAPLIRIVYVLDNDKYAQDAIDHHFFHALDDKNWPKFHAWSKAVDAARNAAGKISRWQALRGNLSFAFGFEHCDRFVPETGNTSSRLLDVVQAARKHGIYNKTKFAEHVQTPRHEVYFTQETADTPEKPGRRTIIVKQSRPGIYKELDDHPRPWDDETLKTDLFRSETGESMKSIETTLDCFNLMKDLISGIVFETVEAWMVRTTDIQAEFNRLEDHVYAHPADDSPSAELWSLSRHLLHMQRMIAQHLETMRWIQKTVNGCALLYSDQTKWKDLDKWNGLDQEWLGGYIQDLESWAQNIEDNFVKPIEHMLDLMYKSVSIRDARLSLELNASLWRLSWITFVFLPLTFLVGFFGMNVNTFKAQGVSIKWYFVAAAPFMALILLLYLAFRHFFTHRQSWSRKTDASFLRSKRA